MRVELAALRRRLGVTVLRTMMLQLYVDGVKYVIYFIGGIQIFIQWVGLDHVRNL